MDTSKLHKTRAEAKAAGAAYYFTGLPCKHGHVAPRKTKGVCVECMRQEWADNLVKRADYFAAYNKSEAGQKSKKRYYADNREAVLTRALATPSAVKNQHRKAWKERNLDWVRADTSARRRRHRQATPPWVDTLMKAQIREVYRVAYALTKQTGRVHHVDHIYPLRGETVCGLHVPWNLQVLPFDENAEKSNALPPESQALAFPRAKWHNAPASDTLQ